MAKIGIIGAGTWGTALAVLLNNNGHEVTIGSIIPEEVEMLRAKRQHEKKLPGVILAPNIDVTGDLEGAMTDKDILVLAGPFPIHKKHGAQYACFLQRRTEDRGCGKRGRRKDIDDIVSDH